MTVILTIGRPGIKAWLTGGKTGRKLRQLPSDAAVLLLTLTSQKALED